MLEGWWLFSLPGLLLLFSHGNAFPKSLPSEK
jgi:hypothetical protein